jgi:hypothetical protein
VIVPDRSAKSLCGFVENAEARGTGRLGAAVPAGGSAATTTVTSRGAAIEVAEDFLPICRAPFVRR